MNRDRQWTCKIGYMATEALPEGADNPLRRAVEAAYEQHFGKEPDFCESGWGEPTPDLGLATTDLLIAELRSRLEGTPGPEGLDELRMFLTPEQLAYRTVDS